MKRFHFYRIFISLSLLITLFAAASVIRQALLADDPDTKSSKIQIDNVPLGPVSILVATSPMTATVGQMSVWVRVTDSRTKRLLDDAEITVEAAPKGVDPALSVEATHENAGNALDYVAHLDLDDASDWDFTVLVERKQWIIDVGFTETVAPGPNTTLLVGLAVTLVISAVIVGGYLWQRLAAG